MTQPSDDETIQRLLKSLHSWDWYNRKTAVEALSGQQLQDERIISALKTVAENDSIDKVREAARQALAGGERPGDTPTSESDKPSETEVKLNLPKSNKSSAQGILDFLAGFVGFLVINAIVWNILTSVVVWHFHVFNDTSPILFSMLILNLVALSILFQFKRRAALGMVAAFGVAVALFILFVIWLISAGCC